MNDMRYFRQALALMREEKLYSAMYIAGTALAVAFVMLIAEVYYVKVADIAPEVHRSTTYYLPNLEIKNSDGSEMKGINQWMFRDLFQKMQTPECVTGVINFWSFKKSYMKLADGIHECAVKVTITEPGGSDSLILDNRPYSICGVIETPSALTERAFADIIVPWTAEGLFARYHVRYEEMPVDVSFAVKADKRKAFIHELREVEARYNAVNSEEPVDVISELKSHYATVWEGLNMLFEVYDGSIWWYVAAAILLLLFVPALNLSSMVASRMERRLPEMAVRKAFGAKRHTLFAQIIMENLALTLIGGLAGLCIAWMALYGWRDWVFYAFSDDSTLMGAVPVLKGEMLFGPAVFAIALLVCCVLNVLAATMPAWFSLRKPIVESMMIKK